ncbi:ROK family transcriptional regulator [Kitasatospora paracochleata]|uniref:NBD/HSP70 family sugar kinase n=1 Tax=Kitasatospora paracochleata TaxID=58354 RepID=A0ABT1IYW4_9ACTN|nr:ROK family transcriptional regulator [Kitasatospora paracochleata]MCP2310323.1 putative NBD/HSP70 family sugar kinase [Kitasatospora paracochleata]
MLSLVAAPTPLPTAPPPEGGAAGTLLRTVLTTGPLTRTALGRATGLSPAAVSRHTTELISLGLLRDLPPNGPPRAGRPRLPLDIDTRGHLAAGVHIGVPWLTFALLDLRGRVVARERLPRQGDARTVLRTVRAHLPGFTTRRAAGRPVLGLGVVTGGWVDTEHGTVVEHTPLGWHDVPVRDLLAGATRLPVHLDGHARALARAELLFGAPAGATELVHLFVGNVVDAAIAAGGTVLRGRRSRAGDIGHLPVPGSTEPCPCGRTGCLQATVSDHALVRRARLQGLHPAPDLERLMALAAAGEPRVLELFRERLRLIAPAAALLLDILGPDVLVLTEAGLAAAPELGHYARQQIRRHTRAEPAHLVTAGSFGTDALAVAACAGVLDSVYRRPMELRTAAAGGSTPH